MTVRRRQSKYMGLTNSKWRASRTQPRVVVADDHAGLRSAVAELLRDSFDVVAVASDGLAAMEVILRLEPDLAVLDISMSGMNGIEVARELRKRSSGVKIVFLTGCQGPDFVEACLAAGGQGYVSKMLMSTDLIPAINEVLAGRVFVSVLPSLQR
jgi:two-component system, NarL family, nitrate/nitrite response regulator NarL